MTTAGPRGGAPAGRARVVLAACAALALSGACTAGPQSAPAPTAPVPDVTGSVPAPAASGPAASGPAASGPAASVPASAPGAALAWRDCGEGFQCATHPVQPDGGERIDLAVVRRVATGPQKRIGSLFVNPGGPGVSAVDYLRRAYAGLPEALRQRFDVVAFDPRGVGASSGVQCASTGQLDRYFALDPSPDDATELRAYEQGNRTLVEGCRRASGGVLPHVATKDAAADLESLRQAVGDERLTYLGYSYGTSIGAAYLAAHPDRVRAMVLDGAIDPTLTWQGLLEGQSRGFDTALQAFLRDCEATRCAFRSAVQGDLAAAYDTLAARVDRTPLPARQGRLLGPGEFSLGVGAGLYDRQYGWQAIAAGLAQAVRGDGRGLLDLSDSYLQRTDEGYAGVNEANLAVNCIDRPWPRDTAAYLALAKRVERTSPRFGAAIALSGLACASWPVRAVDTPRPARGTGSPPVVVIGTTRDPATPYAWAVALADQLDEGVLVTYDGDGHTVYRASAPECVRQPVDDYLLTRRSPGTLRC